MLGCLSDSVVNILFRSLVIVLHFKPPPPPTPLSKSYHLFKSYGRTLQVIPIAITN